MNLSPILKTVTAIATDARKHLLSIARADLQIEKKKDNSFVTRADKETELFIREQLEAAFPDHNILGEEFPSIEKGSTLTWVIDPIDGTHSFRHGIPLYGTMICLMDDDTPLVSLIDLPALDRCYSAARSLGAYCNGTQIFTGDLDTDDLIEDEIIATGERKQFLSCGLEGIHDSLMTTHPHVRAYCDCFGHVLAAEGAVGAMVDFNIRVWDCMASVLIVEEAGGKAVCVNTREKNGSKRYDWVFGKPKVVDWILRAMCDVRSAT